MTENKHYGFEYRAAYDSEVRVELPFRPSASAAPPCGPRLFRSSLYAQKVFAFMSWGHDRRANIMAWVRVSSPVGYHWYDLELVPFRKVNLKGDYSTASVAGITESGRRVRARRGP